MMSADHRQLFYRPCHLHKLLGISRQGLANMEKRGELPARIEICPGLSGWRASDIDSWLATRKEGQPKPDPKRTEGRAA